MHAEVELVRIYIGEDQKHEHCPLYEVIVEEARKFGLAGATVLHGVMGYGKNSTIHSSKVFRLSEDLPLVIEIVDDVERIALFLPYLDSIVKKGLVTTQKVQVLMYRHKEGERA